MKEPVFPQDFVLQQCLQVREERRNRKVYLKEVLPDDEAPLYAECAFTSAGFGLTCENCQMHVSPCKTMNYPQDAFFEAIKKYYDDYKLYEKHLEREKRLEMDCGAGI